MFDVFNLSILYVLNGLKALLGSYGWAIVAITVLLRVVLWPMNTAQTRNMKKMQALQPQLKALQERHKGKPQELQAAMVKFYADNQFNPMAGCLPMLLQIPIFIGLYGALNNPMFLAQAGNESFGLIDKLYHTMQGHAGQPNDGVLSLTDADVLSADAKVMVTLKPTKAGEAPKTLERKLANATHALHWKPKPLIAGEPLQLYVSLADLGMSSDYAARINSADITVVNSTSREVETLKFLPAKAEKNQSTTWLTTPMLKTVVGKNTMHWDVFALVALYAGLTFAYQKLMQKDQASADPQQAKMMNLMSYGFVAMMFFIPMPAGVLLYLVVTMLMMVVQTVWVHRQEDQKAMGQAIVPAVIDVKVES